RPDGDRTRSRRASLPAAPSSGPPRRRRGSRSGWGCRSPPRTPRAGPATHGGRWSLPGNRAPRATRRPASNGAEPASPAFITRARGHAKPPRKNAYPSRMSLPPVEVRDPHDPRLADYRSLKERHLNAEGGRFVAESERVVRRLVGSGLTVHSVLLTPPRLATLADALAGPYPVFVAAQALLDEIAGFHVHRGCLAIGERPAPAALPPGARAVVALEDLTDVDNLGALARHAAAFGADALLLSPRCADPFYRKAIRVSLG